jgi:hypothetical protein
VNRFPQTSYADEAEEIPNAPEMPTNHKTQAGAVCAVKNIIPVDIIVAFPP